MVDWVTKQGSLCCLRLTASKFVPAAFVKVGLGFLLLWLRLGFAGAPSVSAPSYLSHVGFARNCLTISSTKAMLLRPALFSRLNIAGPSRGQQTPSYGNYTPNTHHFPLLAAACVVCLSRLIWR